MHLEPVEIQHVKLRRSLIGYDRSAVDQLLENVTASYEDVWFERAKLEAELASLRNKLDGQAQAKEALEGSVKVAQSTADELLSDARAKADSVVDEAHQRSLATLQETRAEHQRLKVELKKLEVSETEITLRLRALLTAARELLDGHESIRELAARSPATAPSNGKGRLAAPSELTTAPAERDEAQAADPEPDVQAADPEPDVQAADPEPDAQTPDPEPDASMLASTDEDVGSGPEPAATREREDAAPAAAAAAAAAVKSSRGVEQVQSTSGHVTAPIDEPATSDATTSAASGDEGRG